jgi:hypothetical protein
MPKNGTNPLAPTTSKTRQGTGYLSFYFNKRSVVYPEGMPKNGTNLLTLA